MTEDEFDPLPADMMRARRVIEQVATTLADTPLTTQRMRVHKRGIAKLQAAGYAVHHLDGNPTNDDLDNLELRTMHATDFEKQWGIPADGPALTGPNNADRAVLARIGGRLTLGLFARMGWDAATEAEATAGIYRSQSTVPAFAPPMVPVEAFSWPVYRAAYTQSTDSCQSEGHREYRYGPPDISESEARALPGDR